MFFASRFVVAEDAGRECHNRFRRHFPFPATTHCPHSSRADGNGRESADDFQRTVHQLCRNYRSRRKRKVAFALLAQVGQKALTIDTGRGS